MPDRPPLPPELDAHLDQEPLAEREELARVWALLGRAAPPPSPDADAAWQRLSGRLVSPDPEAPRRAPDRPARRQARPLRRFSLAAGVAVAGLLVVAFWWSRPVVVQAPPGAIVRAALPDGSEVALNGSSTLHYRRGFARLPFVATAERRAVLAGEAFFAVVPGTRPFVVETFNAEVTVLGTQFNVRARRGYGEAGTQVAVAEGRVRVEAAGEAVVLKAGQGTAVEETAPTVPEAVPSERAAAWRSGGFAVRDLPLAAVLAEVERRWGVDVALQGASATDHVTLYLARADDAEAVLRDLAAARGLRYRATSTGFVVYPAGN